jgi:hypothetical protein
MGARCEFPEVPITQVQLETPTTELESDRLRSWPPIRSITHDDHCFHRSPLVDVMPHQRTVESHGDNIWKRTWSPSIMGWLLSGVGYLPQLVRGAIATPPTMGAGHTISGSGPSRRAWRQRRERGHQSRPPQAGRPRTHQGRVSGRNPAADHERPNLSRREGVFGRWIVLRGETLPAARLLLLLRSPQGGGHA